MKAAIVKWSDNQLSRPAHRLPFPDELLRRQGGAGGGEDDEGLAVGAGEIAVNGVV